MLLPYKTSKEEPQNPSMQYEENIEDGRKRGC